MSRLPFLIRLTLILAACALTAHAGWDERTIHGRGYVSVNSMKEFYGFKRLSQSGKSIVLEDDAVEIKLSTNSHECYMNGVKFVFSYPIESSGGKAWLSKIDLMKLVHPVLRPNIIENAGNFRTVIIDAGHGGKDPGATNSIGTEANYNLKVAGFLKDYLEKEYKYKVIMTRDSNRYLSLQQRVDIANRITENAIFISIHHNSTSSNRSGARGIETFTLSPVGVSHYGRGLKASDFSPKTGNHHDSANVALATAVHGTLLSTLKDKKTGKSYTLDRGIKRARFSVLSGVKHPSILVECGFMTHPYEAKLIHDSGYQRTVAKSIAYAVQKYRFAVARPNTGQR
ncbi:N-acetylmuramoyl-L-alanineamidase [Haloferula helveola]|uniref:N-acetylmuramoyl-L-alanine amidase n=1 Tax=Haloferula helveola TaxID=490095 RepID=A0ABM7RB17_9BACT|nr:N-acetylmuramoyl-L-alanineamidase [Haloferula helveola]